MRLETELKDRWINRFMDFLGMVPPLSSDPTRSRKKTASAASRTMRFGASPGKVASPCEILNGFDAVLQLANQGRHRLVI